MCETVWLDFINTTSSAASSIQILLVSGARTPFHDHLAERPFRSFQELIQGNEYMTQHGRFTLIIRRIHTSGIDARILNFANSSRSCLT